MFLLLRLHAQCRRFHYLPHEALSDNEKSAAMKLIEVQVRNFRNILASGEVAIQPDVTCLVGKNESGKTAFLQALHRLNPAQGNVSLSIPDHYPAWLEKQHRRKMDLNAFSPVAAKFKIEDSDNAAIESRFGKGVLRSDILTLSRQYDNLRTFDYVADEEVAIATILKQVPRLKGFSERPTDIEGLKAFIATLQARKDDPELVEAAANLEGARVALFGTNYDFNEAMIEALDKLTPKFFYYSEYSRLPGTVKIRELLKADRTKLDDNQLTALALLQLAGAEDDYLLNPDYERRKRELENVANALTQEILEYWTTNREIRVDIDITQQTVPAPNGQQTVVHELKVRLWDNRHFLSLPFDDRSSGFRWFFSFLAAFSAYRYDNDKKVIILLDEPALGLHARAQKDFLRYIDEQLATTRQVIYTTHRRSWCSLITLTASVWSKTVAGTAAQPFRPTYWQPILIRCSRYRARSATTWRSICSSRRTIWSSRARQTSPT